MGLPNEIHPFHLAGAGTGYQVANSLRFRASNSAYLSRSFTGQPSTFTYSFWYKRGVLGSVQEFAYSRNGSLGLVSAGLEITASNTIRFVSYDTTIFTTSAVFRDPSAWYHILLKCTSGSSATLYVNGVSVGSGSVTSSSFLFSNQRTNTISRTADYDAYYLDGYLTEIYFIDSQSLDPSYFGQTDSITGQWVPKKYTGTYGTDGFYLPFNDATSTTTLGYDRQLGMSDSSKNNWTLNNFTVSSSANTVTTTHDSYIDSPTAYNDGSTYYNRGNYATWNPLNAVQSTLSQGNLRSEATGSSTDVITTFPTSTTGKWYAEIGINATPNINWPIRIGAADRIGAVGSASSTYCLFYTDWSSFYFYKSLNGSTSTVAISGSYPADGDILKIAYDADAGKLWIGLNSGWYGTSGSITGDPATGTDATLSGATNKNIYPNHNSAGGPARVMFLNCGQRPFRYTPPSGYLALNTYNLANPSLPLV